MVYHYFNFLPLSSGCNLNLVAFTNFFIPIFFIPKFFWCEKNWGVIVALSMFLQSSFITKFMFYLKNLKSCFNAEKLDCLLDSCWFNLIENRNAIPWPLSSLNCWHFMCCLKIYYSCVKLKCFIFFARVKGKEMDGHFL